MALLSPVDNQVPAVRNKTCSWDKSPRILEAMQWDPEYTIAHALWITGGQWAGKSTPEQMAQETQDHFTERFPWVIDDLRALSTRRPLLVDGWGLRPGLVVPVTGAPERMVVLVPAEDFRQRQAAVLPRALRRPAGVSDPERAQRNRFARDRLQIEGIVRDAREHGVRVIEVDGTQDAEAVAGLVTDHFAADLEPAGS
jgi:hypothetical protein